MAILSGKKNLDISPLIARLKSALLTLPLDMQGKHYNCWKM